MVVAVLELAPDVEGHVSELTLKRGLLRAVGDEAQVRTVSLPYGSLLLRRFCFDTSALRDLRAVRVRA